MPSQLILIFKVPHAEDVSADIGVFSDDVIALQALFNLCTGALRWWNILLMNPRIMVYQIFQRLEFFSTSFFIRKAKIMDKIAFEISGFLIILIANLQVMIGKAKLFEGCEFTVFALESIPHNYVVEVARWLTLHFNFIVIGLSLLIWRCLFFSWVNLLHFLLISPLNLSLFTQTLFKPLLTGKYLLLELLKWFRLRVF